MHSYEEIQKFVVFRKVLSRKYFIAFFVLCLAGSLAFAAELKTVKFGGEKGWKSLSYSKGIQKGVGKFGFESIELSGASVELDDSVDLFLSFENDEVLDEAGNYEIASSSLITVSDSAVMGKKSGLSRGYMGGIKLAGKPNSLFGKQGFTGSFSIDFWLKPHLTESGECIFNWTSSKNVEKNVVYQVIHAAFLKNRLEWTFTNIFSNPVFEEETVVITSHNTIIPEKWAHHVISYDDKSGILEYYINGRIQGVHHVTENGHEGSTINHAHLGTPSEIEICPRFTGYIDDFVISSSVYNGKPKSVYSSKGGRIEIAPIQTTGDGSQLVSVNAVFDQKSQTGMEFFVRAGDNFYEMDGNNPQWVAVRPGEKIEGVQGRFFQIAVNLYPDGNCAVSPSLSEVSLVYSEVQPPLPPVTVLATALDGAVNLRWLLSVDENVGGYLVYYGERPGEYLGRIAVEGLSPIDVGNSKEVNVTGLKNGKIYFFAVAAYSATDADLIGPLSHEVFARPLQSAAKEARWD